MASVSRGMQLAQKAAAMVLLGQHLLSALEKAQERKYQVLCCLLEVGDGGQGRWRKKLRPLSYPATNVC